MDQDEVDQALRKIAGEPNATVKHLQLASLCSAIFAERGIDLVVVGGSAIEFYTEGAYNSAALQQDVEVDWAEVKRLAKSSAYSNWPDVKAITNEQAEALELQGRRI